VIEIVRHHSAERTPGARGATFGRAQKERIALVMNVYRRLFAVSAGLTGDDLRRLGAQALDRIADWSPALLEEIDGIAHGSGFDVELVGALNARTELLAAAAGECSTIACIGTATTSGRPLGVQTWDWHDDLRDGWLVWTIEHADGRRVETLTEAGIVGKIGVNGSGVAILLNILGHRDDRPPVGVPVHALARRVLDEADGAVAAMTLAAGAAVSASSAITIVADDSDGGVACAVELSPAGPGFVMPDARGVLVHTNHFLADPGRQADTMVRESPDSLLRLDHARRRMDGLGAGIEAEDVLAAMDSHRGGAGAICCHPAAGAAFGDRWATLATVVVEPARAEMRVLAGGPCQRAAASTTAAAARQ
jgi:isopenicillin-N N-acyltransferase like protein